MKFININERKPYNGQIVLIKTKQAWLKYYVCQYCECDIDSRSPFFEEASGEQYARWTMDEVEGWIPIEDIEKPDVS